MSMFREGQSGKASPRQCSCGGKAKWVRAEGRVVCQGCGVTSEGLARPEFSNLSAHQREIHSWNAFHGARKAALKAEHLAKPTRRCSVCKKTLPRDHFTKVGAQCKACVYSKQLMRNYGISGDDYSRMFTEQGGKCLICGDYGRPAGRGSDSLGGTTLVVDHNHATGEVRGLLHNWCNSLVGFVERIERDTGQDVKGILESVRRYLLWGNADKL